jgi:hypothetical protein
MMKSFGKKLSGSWLLFTIFKELGIHVNRPAGNRYKRKAVKKIFLAYGFAGSDLESLLRACTDAAGEEMQE